MTNKNGAVLYIVLWSLVVLSMLAMGMGRRTHVDLALTKHSLGRLQARYLAWAGVVYAMDQIRQDSMDLVSSKSDHLYSCGIRQDANFTPEALFKERALGGGHFTVQTHDYYGLSDEERKLNLNAINTHNRNVLTALLELLGYGEHTAEQISASVVDWIDMDQDKASETYGAENDYYLGLSNPYRCKNLPFDSLQELMLVREVTPAIYKRLKPYVTVFPRRTANLRVNFDTAHAMVLKALCRGVSDHSSNTSQWDADSLTKKMIQCRKGEDGRAYTEDDTTIGLKKMHLNSPEKALFEDLKYYRTPRSQYFRIVSMGVEQRQKIASVIEVVLKRQDFTILHWHQS
jgi:general secretion pathway protein K